MATPVAVPTWRSVFTRPAAIPAWAGSTAESAAEARPVEVIPRPIPARMKPGSSTSQVEVAVRWAIEASPAAAATMATPSSTRIATLPISRPDKVLAAAYDLKVFFTVVGKPPEEVRPADVLAFITAQRTVMHVRSCSVPAERCRADKAILSHSWMGASLDRRLYSFPGLRRATRMPACGHGEFSGRAGRRGRRCAGRSSVPAAGARQLGRGRRLAGGFDRVLPGRVLPLGPR